MTRISKYKIKEEILVKMYELFFEIVSRSSQKKQDFLEMLGDVLSQTEKIMVAKRIVIMYLLLKGINQRDIAEILKVSTATTSKFAMLLNSRDTKMANLIKKMIASEKAVVVLQNIWRDLTTQPGILIGHRRIAWEHKKKRMREETYGL